MEPAVECGVRLRRHDSPFFFSVDSYALLECPVSGYDGWPGMADPYLFPAWDETPQPVESAASASAGIPPVTRLSTTTQAPGPAEADPLQGEGDPWIQAARNLVSSLTRPGHDGGGVTAETYATAPPPGISPSGPEIPATAEARHAANLSAAAAAAAVPPVSWSSSGHLWETLRRMPPMASTPVPRSPLEMLNAADQWRHALQGQLGGLPSGVPQDPRGLLGQLPVPPDQLPVPPGQLPVPPGQLPVSPGQLPVPPGQLPFSPGSLLQGPGFRTPSPWSWNNTSAPGQGWRGEFSDPPSWPGWQYRRQWVAAVRRWNKLSDIPISRRAEKVLRTLGWELQVEFEHLREDVLISERYLEAIIEVIELKAGVREDDEKRAAFKGIMVDNVRRREESLSQYVTRRMRDFTKAMMFGISIPEEFRATMLKEGAGLNDQGMQNLTALLQGQDHSVDRVAATLARMDARADRITGFVEVPEGPEPSNIYLAQDDPAGSEGEDSEGTPEEIAEDDMVLAELADMDFSENQAALVFAIMENRLPRRKRTWRENKKYKADLRKDRTSFTKGPSAEHRGSGLRAHSKDDKHRGRMSKEQLKKISKCNTCGRRGHWSEDCPNNRHGGSGDMNAKVQGFCYLGGSLRGASAGYVSGIRTQLSYFTRPVFSYVTFQKEDLSTDGGEETWAFLTIPSGMAILDIGATQDIIGLAALRSLEQELARCNRWCRQPRLLLRE